MNATTITIEKIACNGVKPLKSAVYLLAAELQEIEGYRYFREAVANALKSYDYCDCDCDCDYYYDDDYDDDYYDYYDYDYDYYKLSSAEKTLALLFLSAMYAAKGK